MLPFKLLYDDTFTVDLGPHAFPDYGEGFCLVHDVAIAVRALRAAALVFGAARGATA